MLRTVVLLALTVFVLLGLVSGCSEDPKEAPKKTVIALFGAMEKNDPAALPYLLDLEELMLSMNEDYALQTDSPRVFTSPEEILEDLTGDGRTKQIWFSLQRIISETRLLDSTTASVDVTFVDKERSRGYRTRFGLHLINGKWKIYSFQTLSGR